MGLSRNKVAVSEGAAGSPPFYGESGRGNRMLQTRSYSEIEPAERAGEERREARASAWKEDLVVQLSMIKHRASGEVH